MNYGLCLSVVVTYFLVFGNAEITPNEIEYLFYSREQFEGFSFHTTDDPNLTHLGRVFNPHKPTIILIHGWKDDYYADSNTYVRDAILSKINANIIKVNWASLAAESYFVARDAVPFVGRFAGQLVRSISNKFRYSLEDVTLVGFSLGAHIAGNIGKELKGQISLIIALDPAGPFISSRDTDFSVNPADANYVQVIHTNAGTLGMTDAVGHADFYPNGGSRQPGCGVDLVGGCAHNRAWEYFAESVINNHFVSRRCNSWDDYRRNNCNNDRRLMGGLVTVDRNARGIFYLETNNRSPYARN